MSARASVTERLGAGGLPALCLRDPSADSEAELLPGRGALLSRFDVEGFRVLYLDEQTVADPGQNVRGGVPLLFPQAGRLPGDVYQVEGQPFGLPQHGFARRRSFSVVSTSGGDAATAVLALGDDAESWAVFPFAFRLELTARLAGRALALSLRLENPGPRPLPLHLGLHPYFAVPEAQKSQLRVETSATTAFDNRRGVEGPLPPLDFRADELDLHLTDHRGTGTTLRAPGRPDVRLGWSPGYRVLVLWTKAGKDFVCVEPWTALGGALGTGRGLDWVAPRDLRTLDFHLEVGELPRP